MCAAARGRDISIDECRALDARDGLGLHRPDEELPQAVQA
jgi:hypothetical protein